jgi:putative transposase
VVVALGTTEDATKRILGLRQGATENAAVCTALREDLGARGPDTRKPRLSVLDAMAPRAAGKRVWARNAVIRRARATRSATSRRTLRVAR